MKKGQVLQGTVAYVDFPNKGVVKVEEGKQVIVKNVLPGQEISFSVNKVRKGKGEGRLLEVLKKAPNELPEARILESVEAVLIRIYPMKISLH